MSKRVTVTVAVCMDSEFVSLLNVCVALSGLREKDQLTPVQQLGLSILAEARGAYEAEVHQTILPCWRPHFEVLSELRKVREVSVANGRYVEYLDNDPTNNDPSNLRIVTAKENLPQQRRK